MTLLEVELITGKTHQIRGHMASEGHPLLGDYKYGDKAFNHKYKDRYGISSQLLHAYRLEFPVLSEAFHDLSEKTVIAAEPELFQKILNREEIRKKNLGLEMGGEGWRPGIQEACGGLPLRN